MTGRIPVGWAVDEMLGSDVMKVPIGLLGMPYDITFRIKAVTIRTKVGGYVGDWVGPDGTIVRNDDGRCSTLKYTTALVDTNRSKTPFEPVNVNQQGYKDCRKVVNISAKRNIQDEKAPISLGTLRLKTRSLWDLNDTKRPVTLTLEYTIRRQKDPTKTGAGTLLRDGKLIISVSEFRDFRAPAEVYFAESNMNGSNLKQHTIKISDATPDPRLYISLVPNLKAKKKMGLILSYMKKEDAPDMESAMSTVLTGLEIAAKIGIQIALPGIGTAIVVGIEILENVDTLMDLVYAFQDLFKVLPTCNTKKIINALEVLFEAIIAFGFAVLTIILSAADIARIREAPYLINKLDVLFVKSLPRHKWPKAVGTDFARRIATEAASGFLNTIKHDGIVLVRCVQSTTTTRT
ncbi:hypothetical protein TWF730_000183 [Orbilia blumenaviensis]|uniref:Uncharacterized protein n=1 Tax=Orbilia blumenaviensis TaxID=1796055 RepID=A0AAV9VL43_9PEZI